MSGASNFTLGSLFDGIGGFPLAASYSGIRPLWASEILPAAISVTRRHFPDMEHAGDIVKLDGAKLPPVGVITFGSPCQGLSMAGRRRGFADERSGLFSQAIRIIDEMREATHGEYPRFAVWENVPGALSSGNPAGSDFQAVLEAFTKTTIPLPPSGKWTNAGMVRGDGIDLAWTVYDARHFRLAQRRRRVFLVVDFGGQRAGEILFVPKGVRWDSQARGAPGQAAAAPAQNRAGAADGQSFQSNCLNGWDTQQCRVFTENGCAPTLAGADGGGGRNPAGLVFAAFMGGQSPASGRFGYSERTAPTLKSANNGSNMIPCVCEPEHARTLTARGDSSPCWDRGQNIVVVERLLCAASGQANAEVLENRGATLTAGHEQPILYQAVGVHQNQGGDVSTSDTAYSLATNGNATGRNAPLVAHPKVSGTLCASGAGLSRPAGMASETDLCVVAAVDCRNYRETGDISGTLQSKNAPGYSLNYQNPVRTGYVVRRLTPVECERLQGFPDGWTAFGHDGKPLSDTRRYQMLGNSVAVPCVAHIMRGIADAL